MPPPPLSVGLAPGITNLLAHHVHQRLPAATAVDISMCFGLAGDHGADSRRWVIDALTDRAAPAPAEPGSTCPASGGEPSTPSRSPTRTR